MLFEVECQLVERGLLSKEVSQFRLSCGSVAARLSAYGHSSIVPILKGFALIGVSAKAARRFLLMIGVAANEEAVMG